jgi:anti-sigma factor RsiW
MTNDELHDLTAAYALDALDADDRSAFESHLSGCDQCRADLAELSETVSALAYAAEGPVAPDELRDRIVLGAREEGASNVVALRPRRLRLYAGAAAALAACAALAIGLTLGLSGGGTHRVALRGATGSLVWHTSGHATLTVEQLAAAPGGKVYEAWIVDNGSILPGGVFTGGGATSKLDLIRPVPTGALVAVTLERKPGADVPHPPILFSARVPA